MLAHQQGAQLNVVKIGASLGVTSPTAKRYIELLEDLLFEWRYRSLFNRDDKGDDLKNIFLVL